MMRGKLNSFQKTMLQWNQLHAYNAVHVVQVAGSFDQPKLTSVINEFLERSGVTGLNLDLRRGTFGYAGGAGKVVLHVLPQGGNPLATLAGEMERQLNKSFDLAGEFDPFRFFVVPDTDAFLLGLVYFHVVADAESIVLLLRGLVAAYSGGARCWPEQPLERYPRNLDNLLRHRPGVILERLRDLPDQTRRLRSSMRVPVADILNMRNGLRLFTVGKEDLERLVLAARDWRVTVNDVFLALLLLALAPVAGNQVATGRRRMLSLGCIVNLRKDLGVDGSSTFGLFLGSFVITHAVARGVGLPQLAAEIRHQTLAIKRRHMYLATPWELVCARLVLAFFSPEQRKKFYQKNYPLWGGITNMNLNSLWPAAGAVLPPDYFRAVSTGPVTPLVLAVTTAGEHANIGLTYRTTVFPEATIERIVNSIREMAGSLDPRR